MIFILLLIIFFSFYILFSKDILYSILAFFFINLFVGFFYLSLGSPFLFIVHIFLYSGIIIVLFIFVIHTDHLKKVKDIKLKEILLFSFSAFIFYFLVLNEFKKYPFPKKFIFLKMEFIFEVLFKNYAIFLLLIPLIFSIGIIGTFMIIKEK